MIYEEGLEAIAASESAFGQISALCALTPESVDSPSGRVRRVAVGVVAAMVRTKAYRGMLTAAHLGTFESLLSAVLGERDRPRTAEAEGEGERAGTPRETGSFDFATVDDCATIIFSASASQDHRALFVAGGTMVPLLCRVAGHVARTTRDWALPRTCYAALIFMAQSNSAREAMGANIEHILYPLTHCTTGSDTLVSAASPTLVRPGTGVAGGAVDDSLLYTRRMVTRLLSILIAHKALQPEVLLD
ncbi:hypothetical protein KIPB_010503, partial [Kipferlia bialata]|eukprot:g10503.t1